MKKKCKKYLYLDRICYLKMMFKGSHGAKVDLGISLYSIEFCKKKLKKH